MSTKPFEFEKALKELEDIASWFESSDVDLDAGLAKFERGMTLAAELKTHLGTIENRVEKIKARFAPGASATEAAGQEDPDEDEDEPSAPATMSGQTDLFGT
ncbi:MAG TPA: exodeoxyribonuclease VII small subunit [Candidatus Saccharimonadia bacterium]|jgi:exodeoxyribonuclease VII small subunit|nr:exodeoxyribonuclease VII small subunit [Candidatus Saccharimonadia bacterium]